MEEMDFNQSIDQNQVDDIFGDSKHVESKALTGINLLLDKNISSSSRLPMLEIIFDRFIRAFCNSLRSFSSFTVDVEIQSVQTMRFGDYIDMLPIPTMIAPFLAVEWENYGLAVFDNHFIYSFIDILFGGRKLQSSLKVEGRPYTSIEINLIQSINELLLADLSLAFEPVASINFQLDRFESNPKFASISRPEDMVIALKLFIKMESRNGSIDIIMPYSTIEPVKKLLAKSFIGEKISRDPAWTEHMRSEIKDSIVELEVILNGITSNLKDVASLKVGDTIMLDKDARDNKFVIAVQKVKISEGELGKVEDKVAIKLCDPLNIGKAQI